MKKLVACACLTGLLASPAFAETAFKLDMTGYFKGYVVAAHQDEAAGSEARGVDIIRDAELHFVGETTLENGLTVGADVGAAFDPGESFDITDSFVYFSGGWGHVNVGATDGAGYLLQIEAPSVDMNYDGKDQYFTPFNYAVTGVTQLESIEFDYDHDLAPSDKLTYLSPVFSGFQLGVSYVPEAKSASRGGNGVSAVNDEDDLANIVDLAVRYQNDVSWGSYAAGAGYSHGTNEDGVGAGATEPSADRTLWSAGLDLNVGVWGIGAVYTHDDLGRLGGSVSDQRQWILGADYTGFKDFILAASYLNQTNAFGVNDIDTARYTAGVTWTYGPGIDFSGALTHIDHRVDAALGNDVSGTAVLLGTSICF